MDEPMVAHLVNITGFVTTETALWTCLGEFF